MRRWAPWIVLLVLAAGGLVIGLHRTSPRPTINQEVLQIAGAVRCPVCDGETAAQSQAAASVQIRAQILRELQAGESRDQILAGLVQSYGSGILEKPQPSGVGLLVWVLPVVLVLVAGAVLALAFVKWRARAAAGSGVPPGADQAPAGEKLVGSEGSAPAESPALSAPAPAAAGSRAVSAPAPAASESAAASVSLSGSTSATSVGTDESTSAQPDDSRLSLSEPVDPTPSSASPESPGSPETPPRRRRRRWKEYGLAAAGLALVASGVSYALVASTSTRLAGETITGQALGPEVIESDLATAASDANKNNILGAVKEYQKILAADPTEPDALTGEGWLLAQSGQPSLLQQGLQLLASAEQYDPTYAPAHVYRGLALLVEDDYQDSIPELKWYLAHSPEPQLVPSVTAALQKAEAGAAAAAKASG